MVRKMLIALAAGAAVIAGSTLATSARPMGGMGHARIGGMHHAGIHHRAIHHHRFVGHHRFVHTRLVVVGAAYPYADGCLRRIWTPLGWRWRNVCY
jgi:hypothetical protein